MPFHLKLLLNQNILPLFLYETCVVCICLVGDFYIHSPYLAAGIFGKDEKFRLWSRALVDNLTHGFVGLFSWAVVINFSFKGVQIIPLFLCFFLASSVDLDHFLAAKSTDIKDALNLTERPPFHASTVILLVSGTAWIVGYVLNVVYSKVFSLMFLTAWLSHHIRDGSRRGLWFPPFGSTAPLPYILYLGSVMILPIIVRYIYVNIFHNITE